MAADLYHRFEGYDELKPILDGSDEDVLVRLGKPTLVRVPGTDDRPRSRFVACLLHGNEDSGYRAVLELLRTGERYPFDLWVFIGNVRAARPGHGDGEQDHTGWFAHRYLDGQEDFNRVWGLNAPTTRMRRCADAILDELRDVELEAGLDLHNNTGANPYYAILPHATDAGMDLAATCADTVLHWRLRAHTLMEVLSARCPTIAVECGLPGLPDSTRFAVGALHRYLTAALFEGDGPPRLPEQIYEMRYRVDVRPEVRFVFGGVLAGELDLVLTPGLEGHNFGAIFAGTEIGRVDPGAAVPLLAIDMAGREVTDRIFAVTGDGRLVPTEDITPVMMTTTVEQTRRDCLCYIARRRA